jgi:hypothetical protein
MALKYWVGGSGTWDNSSTANWSDASGGAGGATAPTNVDDVFFDASSGAGVVSVASNAVARNINVNKVDIELSLQGSVVLQPNSRTFTFQQGIITLNGHNLTVGLFRADYNNARTINFDTGKIVIFALSGVVLNLSFGAQLTLTGSKRIELDQPSGVGTRTVFGTFTTQSANENNVPNVYVLNGADTIALSTSASGFGTLDFTGFAGSLTGTSSAKTIYGDLVLSSSMTVSGLTSGLTFASTNATPRSITTAGKTLDCPLTFNGLGGTFEFQDALTQGSTRAFTITNGTVKLKNGVTSTVGAFATSGTDQKFLQSTTAGSQATLSQAGGTVNANNLTIKDINATGGATWSSLWSNNNVDAGNNTGWVFGDPPIALATEYTYALRSFTQPRRF